MISSIYLLFYLKLSKYWSSFYAEQDLQAFAIQPSIVYPSHFTGEPNHVSDTEQSKVIELETPNVFKDHDLKFDKDNTASHLEL